MAELTSRERLTRCFYHQEIDRPAVYSRTAFPKSDPSYDRLKQLIIEKTDLKKDWNGIEVEKYDIHTSQEPYREGYIKIYKTLKTPKGNLTSTSIMCIQDSSTTVVEYFIKDERDIEKYLSLPFPEIRVNPSLYYKAEQDIGDRGIVITNLGSNPGGSAAELCGSDTFALLSITNRDLLYELCEHRCRIILSVLEKLKEHKIGRFFAMQGEEYITPPLHGPKDFYDFNVKYDKRIIDTIHDMGGRIHIHSHGSIKKVLDGFLEMGVDVLHPFEAPPLGDITIKEAKEKVKDKICIEGNIEISYMYEKTPEEIIEITTNLIKEGFYDNKGLIVSPTASPCFYGRGEECYDQYVALIETVVNWPKG